MKTAFLLLVWLSSVACADESDNPPFHFFVVPSPSDHFHVVQTVLPWDRSPDIGQFGRLQMFETQSGRELWRLDGVLAYETDVFPSDDGEHLVLASTELAYVGNAVKTTTPVVSFYVHSHLLKSYSLQDLHIDPTKLEHSVSHTRLFKPQAAFRAWRWENPLGTKEAEVDQLLDSPNPRWQNGFFKLDTLDGQTFRFDLATGSLLPPVVR